MIQLLQADARHIPLRSESVHAVVTSPPYFSLRNYGIDGQLGLEKVADCLGWATGNKCETCYICRMVEVFREVKRVLRSDGVVFLNIGDSYNGSGRGGGGKQDTNVGSLGLEPLHDTNLKPKDMLLIPSRLALALQADSWWIRSDIIWSKPNPMPESVTDRPTKAHEYIWLLAKSKDYFWDAEAVREEQNGNAHSKGTKLHPPIEDAGIGHKDWHKYTPAVEVPGGRNLRTVWNIATQPYPGSHYATYPEELVLRCLKAATSERGVCPKCGKQWEREIERVSTGKRYATGKSEAKNKVGLVTAFSGYDDGSSAPQFKTIGFRPSCSCGCDNTIPATIFDPFAGSGTTLLVAKRMGLSAVGCDLSYQYLDENARERIELRQEMLL